MPLGLGSRILRACSVTRPARQCFSDTPEANPAAIALAGRHGMTPVFETARMYKNGSPAMRLDRCFGVTTFEPG
jgi:hypothetical protein